MPSRIAQWRLAVCRRLLARYGTGWWSRGTNRSKCTDRGPTSGSRPLGAWSLQWQPAASSLAPATARRAQSKSYVTTYAAAPETGTEVVLDREAIDFSGDVDGRCDWATSSCCAGLVAAGSAAVLPSSLPRQALRAGRNWLAESTGAALALGETANACFYWSGCRPGHVSSACSRASMYRRSGDNSTATWYQILPPFHIVTHSYVFENILRQQQLIWNRGSI
jgi:hypothetical protein